MRNFLLGLAFGSALTVALGVSALVGIGRALAVEDALVPADAIVAISGDAGARTETAIDLWKRGLAPVIVFSGASVDPASASSAELMRREALRSGVPARAVLVEPDATTTEENADRVARLMLDRKIRSAILVTSPYHQRRAALVFERAFAADGLTFRNYPARDPEWSTDLWWTREPSRTRTVIEIAKLGAEVLHNTGRKPPTPTSP